LLDYIYNKKFPKPNEYFSYCCPLTKITLNYTHPSKYDIPFLPMEYLGPIIFRLLSPKLIIELLLKILTEQSIIFISEDLQKLTAMV
jgi:hypothetical protein